MTGKRNHERVVYARFTSEEYMMLSTIAKVRHLKISSALRQMVVTEYERILAERGPAIEEVGA